MAIVPGTTIEYEDKKHAEITSAYSYVKYVTGWTSHELGNGSANTICRWDYPNQKINVSAGDTSVYADIVWIYDENNAYTQETALIPVDENDTLPVITKLDLQKYKYVINTFQTVIASDTGTSYSSNTRTAAHEMLANELIYKINCYWIDKEEEEAPVDKIKPLLRYIVDGQIWYFQISCLFETYIRNVPNDGNKLDATNPYGSHMPHDSENCLFHAPTAAYAQYNFPALGNIFNCGGSDGYKIAFYNLDNSSNLLYSMADSIDTMLRIVATLGVYFEYDSIMYLGFMDESGQTTGDYLTADKWNTSAQYESDNINNYTEHNPPYVPPYDDEDNEDPLSTVGAPFGTGLAHYYISTVDGAALTQISEAMSTWDIDATKKDLYRNLISCKIVKPPTAVPATPGVFEIYGVKPQYQGADITINEVTGNPDISFGPYSIDRKFNDFRDRAPYSKAEIFLPYCGWCALPSHVIGRSVSVAYYSDIIAGTVKAVVYCGTNPVAEASGVMSVDIPFAAQNVGEKVAAANIGMLAYGRASIQTAAGIGTAFASKGKSGWGNILSGGTAVMSAYNQLAQVENGNYTEICGKSGDGCALAGVDTIVIKITRPLYGGNTTAPYVPAGFAHTVGYVSMKQSKVKACTGLIVCDNVEVSGISGATDAERAEIRRVLETGLYVNTPPE